MPTSNDKNEADSVVVGVIERLIKRVEDFEATIGERQATFEKNLFDQFVALRQDIYESVLNLKVKYDTHESRHFIDDQRRETDTLTRAHRQFTLNLILGGIIALIIIGFIVIGSIVLLVRP